jgi:hypothetical protein
MHAVVGVWTIADDRRESQERALRDVVPCVTAQPGFVAGYWMLDAETGKSYTTIQLDSEESARQFQALLLSNARAHARAGVTSDYLIVVDVVANADRSSR